MKKKSRIISLLLMCVLLVGMLCSFASAMEPRYYSYGTVTVSSANLRAEPKIDDSNILGSLVKGVRVRILAGVTNDGIDWYEVRVCDGANSGKTGYVSTGCIVLD